MQLRLFTARRCASAVYAVVVCPSVRPSHACIVPKRLHLGWCKQRCMVAQGLQFSHAKALAKFQRGHPQRGHQIKVGYFTIGDFWPISRYISKRCKIGTWLLWNANRNSYALYQMALVPLTWGDPKLRQTTKFSIFCIAFRIFIMATVRDFKFGKYVGRIKC